MPAALSLAVLIGAPAASGHPKGGVVSIVGQIGPLRLDRSSEDDIRRAHWPPDRVVVSHAREPRPYRLLVYRCGAGCDTWYYVSRKTGRLSDFQTTLRAFRTPEGSRVGTARREAERREEARAKDGCLFSIALRQAGNRLELEIERGKVSRLLLSGPNSVVTC